MYNRIQKQAIMCYFGYKSRDDYERGKNDMIVHMTNGTLNCGRLWHRHTATVNLSSPGF